MRNVIDDNMICLKGLIDTEKQDFLLILVREKCITSRHRDRVFRSKLEERAYELLIILQRRRHIDYLKFMECLRKTMQNNIIKVLEKGGVTQVTIHLLHGRDDKQNIEGELIKKLTGYVDKENESDLSEDQRHFIDKILAELEANNIYFIGSCMGERRLEEPSESSKKGSSCSAGEESSVVGDPAAIPPSSPGVGACGLSESPSVDLFFQSKTNDPSNNVKSFGDSGLMRNMLEEIGRCLLQIPKRFASSD